MRHLLGLQIAYLLLYISIAQTLLSALSIQKSLEDGKHKCAKALKEIRSIGGN